MRALLIPADPDQPVTEIDLDGSLAGLQSAVGGDIEAIRLRGHTVTVYLNDEGKFDGSARNERGTHLAAATRSLRNGDWIAGNMVLTGPADDEGNDTDLSDSELNWILSVGLGL